MKTFFYIISDHMSTFIISTGDLWWLWYWIYVMAKEHSTCTITKETTSGDIRVSVSRLHWLRWEGSPQWRWKSCMSAVLDWKEKASSPRWIHCFCPRPQTQCDQLPLAPASRLSPSWWAVPQTVSPNTPTYLNCFCWGFVKAMGEATNIDLEREEYSSKFVSCYVVLKLENTLGQAWSLWLALLPKQDQQPLTEFSVAS